jgi:hypothetical protein
MMLRSQAVRTHGRSGVGRTLVTPPAGLGWTPSWSIYKTGSAYSTSIDFDALKPTPVFTYYCSPTGSAAATPSDNDPNTPITPRRFVTLANANGGIVEAKIAGGVYYGNIGFDGNNLTCAGVVLSLWAGQQSAGRPCFVKRGTNLIAPWSADTGATYFTAHSVANTQVFDRLYRDADGIIPRLTGAASLAACRATPGSYFYDSGTSRMYVTAQDSRNLTGDVNMLVPTSGTNLSYVPTIDAQLWMDGIDFVGGAMLGTMATAAKTLLWNGRDIGYFSGTNGLALTGTIDAINISPRVGGGNSDGMNYHGTAQGQVRALEYDLRSARSGFDASTANNTSTLHESCIGISVGGDYAGSQDRVIHDINSASRFMVGSTIRASAGAGATSITIQAGSSGTAAEIWLDNCIVENSTTGGLYADTGCAIRYRNMSIAGLTTAGAGTIEAFTS